MLNATFHEQILPSDNFILIVCIAGYITLLALLCSYGLLLWVCLTKSPSAMSGYKWLLLMNATFGVLLELQWTVTIIELLFPYPIIVLAGPIMSNIVFSDTAMLLWMYIFGSILFSTLFTNAILFPYRYCQTTSNWFYRNLLSKAKYTIILGSFFLIFSCATIIVPLQATALPGDDLKNVMKNTDMIIYDLINQRSFIGAVREGNSNVGIALLATVIFWCVLVPSMAIFSTFACYKYLRDNKSHFTNRTGALYLTLTNALVIETCIGFFLVLTPLAILAWTFYTESKYASNIGLIAERTASIYPLSSNVILLYVVRPYRRAIVNLFNSGKHFLTPMSNPGSIATVVPNMAQTSFFNK